MHRTNKQMENKSSTNSRHSAFSVAVRCRPLTPSEEKQTHIVHILEECTVILLNPQDPHKQRVGDKEYSFDLALGEEIPQSAVYSKTASSLVEGVVQGYNATVFAYGATNAGKTYTMIGTESAPGLIFSAFSAIAASTSKVRISYLEIYNENVRDLLTAHSENLELREDKQGISVVGLSSVEPEDTSEILGIIKEGNARRVCEPTQANQISSRSHAILQITVEQIGRSEMTSGKLSLIDLAGSERAANTKNAGLRLLEGASINKSLLALGNCINALSEGNKGFVRYRDSKLTRLLKDSLGGNSRTLMIACVSPAVSDYENTSNTLKYALRAKKIKTNVKRNVYDTHLRISKYNEVIDHLQKEVNSLKNQLSKVNTGYPIEMKLIEINKHFTNEVNVRKEILKIEKAIDEAGFLIYSMQLKSSKSKSLEKIKASVKEREIALKSTLEKIEVLERKRKEFRENWNQLKVPEPFLSQLKLYMNEKVLSMNSIELQRKDERNEALLKQRDLVFNFIQGKHTPMNGSSKHTPMNGSSKHTLMNDSSKHTLMNDSSKHKVSSCSLPELKDKKRLKTKSKLELTPKRKNSQPVVVTPNQLAKQSSHRLEPIRTVAEMVGQNPYVLSSKSPQSSKVRLPPGVINSSRLNKFLK